MEQEKEWQMLLEIQKKKQDAKANDASSVSLSQIQPEFPNASVPPTAPSEFPTIPSRDTKPDFEPPPPYSASIAQDGMPEFDRTTKPNHLTSSVDRSSNKFGLRDVVVPERLMSRFTDLAELNTRLNIETCGIVAGKLARGSFRVTHLLIPQQKGTPDSCTTENEEDIFEYQDQHDLITLGWIHTHPSQTSFLSSVDLHTQCSYQLMMPEAIAIVCAPKYRETGIYSLTFDYGLDFIANCRESSFHPHPSKPILFEESSHVKIERNAEVTIMDLRK